MKALKTNSITVSNWSVCTVEMKRNLFCFEINFKQKKSHSMSYESGSQMRDSISLLRWHFIKGFTQLFLVSVLTDGQTNYCQWRQLPVHLSNRGTTHSTRRDHKIVDMPPIGWLVITLKKCNAWLTKNISITLRNDFNVTVQKESYFFVYNFIVRWQFDCKLGNFQFHNCQLYLGARETFIFEWKSETFVICIPLEWW